MIDHHIAKEMQAAYQEVATAGGQMDSVNAAKFPVLNMLNTKYFIFLPGNKAKQSPLKTHMLSAMRGS